MCLCVRCCPGRVWNILAQIRERCVDHCRSMITSCPTSAASQIHPHTHTRPRCVRVCVLMRLHPCAWHAHLCCLSVSKETRTLCCLLLAVQGFPSFTCDYGKSHRRSLPRHFTEPPSELYSVCVIRQKTGKRTHTSEPVLTHNQSPSQTQDSGFIFLGLYQPHRLGKTAVHCPKPCLSSHYKGSTSTIYMSFFIQFHPDSLHKCSMFYMQIHLVKPLSKSKGSLTCEPRASQPFKCIEYRKPSSDMGQRPQKRLALWTAPHIIT